MSGRQLALAIWCMAVGPIALTSTASAAVPTAAAVPADALRVAMLLNPPDKLLHTGEQLYRLGTEAGLKKSTDAAKVYEQNPGLLEAIVTAGEAVFAKYFATSIPTTERVFARFFAENYSPDEIRILIAFFSSPTGAKFVASEFSDSETEEMFRTGHVDNQRASAELMRTLDEADLKAVNAFTATPVYAKMSRLAPEYNRMKTAAWNQHDPAMDGELKQAVETAVKAYMAKRNAAPTH